VASVDFASYGGEELAGSPVINGSANSMTGVRRGHIEWGKILNFYAALFPAAVSGISQLPATFPNLPFLYADSVSFKSTFDEDSPAGYGPPNIYNKAAVEVQYKTLSYEQVDPQSDQVISRRHSISNQVLQLPNVSLKWADTGKLITNPEFRAGKLVSTIRHEITFHKLTGVPWNTVRILQGRVNGIGFEGASPECLLFDGVDVGETVSVSSNGAWSTAYEATLVFLERNSDGVGIGWNHMLDPDTGSWRRVIRADGSGGVYLTGNFYLLY
jgi:hypothetical protein